MLRRLGWSLLKGIGLILALVVISFAVLWALYSTEVLPYDPFEALSFGWKWITNGGPLEALGKLGGLLIAGWFVMGFLDFIFDTDDSYYPRY